MSYRKTTVEIDEDLLAAVQRIMGTGTLKATIEEAFREILRLEARRAEVKALSTMKGMDLNQPDVMTQSWSEEDWSRVREALGVPPVDMAGIEERLKLTPTERLERMRRTLEAQEQGK